MLEVKNKTKKIDRRMGVKYRDGRRSKRENEKNAAKEGKIRKKKCNKHVAELAD